jgi:thiosulfate/3-mercaptopyruvate sulfurtransferase
MEDGKNGRQKEKEYTKSIPRPKNSRYHATPPNEGMRAYFSDVRRALESTETTLVDVRSPKEFAGEITAPPEYPMEHAQRGWSHTPCQKYTLASGT